MPERGCEPKLREPRTRTERMSRGAPRRPVVRRPLLERVQREVQVGENRRDEELGRDVTREVGRLAREQVREPQTVVRLEVTHVRFPRRRALADVQAPKTVGPTHGVACRSSSGGTSVDVDVREAPEKQADGVLAVHLEPLRHVGELH